MKKLLYVILAILALLTAGYFAINERLPYGESGSEAEALADKMLSAVNIQGWDSITAIKWTFRGGHHFLWDKKRDLVQVNWDKNKVLLNTNTRYGKVWRDGIIVENEERKNELVETAWSYFANDSFWFSAPFKIRDPGTERKLVKNTKNNALLVTYTSGGVTPGDSYLWISDENGLPTSWKMWVSILPVGGLQFTWEDWNTYDNETKISTVHSGIIDVVISNLQTAQDIKTLANGKDPFADFN